MFKKPIKFILIVCLISFILCKPKQSEESIEVRDLKLSKGIGFTVIDNIPVYKEYKIGSPLLTHLPIDSELKITGFLKTEYRGIILDWIGIKKEDTVGYIPGSYLTKQNLAVFNPIEERTGMITASYLRVREKPSLTAKVISQVPRGTTVTILMEGITLQTIEDRTDKWVQIKTSDGKIGFSFKGFIQDVFEKDLSNTESGYIELTSLDLKYWKSPGKVIIQDPVDGNPDDFCKLLLKFYPKPGAILKVSEKKTVDSKTYYKMDHHNSGCDFACPCGLQDFHETWFSEEQVKYIPEADITDYSLSKYEKTEYMELLKEYAKMRNNKVNYSYIKFLEKKIKTLSGLENEIFELRDEYANSVRVFLKKENQFQLLLGGSHCNSYSYIDINGDGIFEITETSGGNDGGGQSYTNKVFYLKKGIYEKIFEYNTMYSQEYRIDAELNNSNIILTHYRRQYDQEKGEFTDQEDVELTEIYTFKNGNFTLTKEIKKTN
ncbi:MAG: SH3 domain-containing protein [Leptospiraceae bacterium]|nr:SH3 domain-containing protein [Leptospiraceae bacterium]